MDIWSKIFKIRTKLPIDLFQAKAYVFADVEFNANHWTRVFRTETGPVVGRVRQQTPLSRDLTIKLEAGEELDDQLQDELIEKLKYEIGADDTLEALKKARETDFLIDIVVKSNPGFRLYANSDPIQAGICAMISQNLDLVSYIEILYRFLNRYGKEVPWDKTLRVFPSNETIAGLTPEDWTEFNLGYKADYLGGLAEKDLKAFQIYSYYPVYDRGINGLKQIDGVGDYTARIIMIYAARRYEKAIYDGYIQDILDHKYKLHQTMPLSEFDKWVDELLPESPALVLHAHIQDYLPAFVRDYNYKKLRQG